MSVAGPDRDEQVPAVLHVDDGRAHFLGLEGYSGAAAGAPVSSGTNPVKLRLFCSSHE